MTEKEIIATLDAVYEELSLISVDEIPKAKGRAFAQGAQGRCLARVRSVRAALAAELQDRTDEVV